MSIFDLYKTEEMNLLRQNRRRLLLWVSAAMLLSVASCTTPLKEITYLNNVRTGSTYPNGQAPETYKIRTNDHLYILVIGDDPTALAFVNLMPASAAGYASQNLDLVTFIVDEAGNINYPQFGTIHVAGQTIEQIRGELQKRVNKFMENASVFVKLVNRTITVLGEVRVPGQHEMVQNQISIFEAIGSAGDITDFGNRRNVKLIRESPAGKEVTSIDLTDPNLVSSPNYYILPHDILYVEPASKIYGRKSLGFGSGISLIFSAISTALLLISYIKP
jgi:polysaccharide biosynthesis/export protein